MWSGIGRAFVYFMSVTYKTQHRSTINNTQKDEELPTTTQPKKKPSHRTQPQIKNRAQPTTHNHK